MATAIAEDGSRIKYRKILGSSDKVLDAWMDQSQPDGWDHSGGHFFFEGDTIYSYGRLFPMAIRMVREDGSVWYLINGDTYGNTTSKHQGWVRGAVTGNRWAFNGQTTKSNEYFIIPFSALARAGISPHDVDPIDSEGERVWTEMRREKVFGPSHTETSKGVHVYKGDSRYSLERAKELANGAGFDNPGAWGYYDPDLEYEAHVSGEWTGKYEEKPVERHLMGSTLFKATIRNDKKVEYPGIRPDQPGGGSYYLYSGREIVGSYDYVHTEETAYFISGLDSTGRVPENSFFLTRLDVDYWQAAYGRTYPPATVQEAYTAMQPVAVCEAIGDGLDVKRQGDWFFLPIIKEDARSVQLTRLDRKKLVQASQYLERPDGLAARQMGATRHLVTRLAVIDGSMYVRGMVRHDVGRWERNRGDVHKSVKLGDTWHLAIPNIQLGSWSTGGRID